MKIAAKFSLQLETEPCVQGARRGIPRHDVEHDRRLQARNEVSNECIRNPSAAKFGVNEQPSDEAASMTGKPNDPRGFLRYNNLRHAEKPRHCLVSDERHQGSWIQDAVHFVRLAEIVDLAYRLPVIIVE